MRGSVAVIAASLFNTAAAKLIYDLDSIVFQQTNRVRGLLNLRRAAQNNVAAVH
jgi:hypothetical protein